MDRKELDSRMREWRHYLHRHPESAFEEENTAAFLTKELSVMGYSVTGGFGGTGFVAEIKRGEGGKVVGIRSDIDSLKIIERGTHDHVSENEGRMHACGHDGHMTTLLGAAALLADEGGFNGTLRLIFQPAEEPGRGAAAMIKDGLFERFPVDEIYALHNAPFMPVGTAAMRTGGMASSEDDFTIKITGKGGHASSPHEGVDPLACFSEMYMAFQTVVSRNAPPTHPLVISCTEIETDGAHNAIPTHVEVRGDVRAYSEADQELAETRMRSIAEHVCAMNGATCEFTYTHEFHPVINDAACVEKMAKAAAAILGEENVNADCDPWTVSEDFSEFLTYAPGCMYLLGSGRPNEKNLSLHDNCFDYNDDALLPGAEIWARLVRGILK